MDHIVEVEIRKGFPIEGRIDVKRDLSCSLMSLYDDESRLTFGRSRGSCPDSRVVASLRCTRGTVFARHQIHPSSQISSLTACMTNPQPPVRDRPFNLLAVGCSLLVHPLAGRHVFGKIPSSLHPPLGLLHRPILQTANQPRFFTHRGIQ